MYCSTVLGKSGRVENDKIVRNEGVVQELEGVFAIGLVTLVVREVERHITACQVAGFLSGVDRMDQFGAAPHGIDGETACIAEHVEYVATSGVSLH